MDTLKVIVVAYNRVLPLQILINCFRVQTDPRWEMYIIHDGPAPKDVSAVIPDDPRVHFYETTERHGKYGHPNRRWLLQNIETKNDDWILITNDDNYYVPDFIKLMRGSVRSNAGVFYCDCLHNYYSYDVLKTKMQVNYVDMGSFAVRADIAKQVGFTSDEYHADGIYAEAVAAYCARKGLQVVYLPKALFIHN